MENDFVYREINPHSVEDINKYLEIHQQLNTFLKKKVKPLTEDQIKWMRIRMGAVELLNEEQQKSEYAQGLLNKPDEICIVCEFNNEIIGYIYVNTYNVKNGERTNDDVGIISDIFVKKEFRNSVIAFKLLKIGVNKLIEFGKYRAICNVQEDNENRFLHFAMADGNVVSTHKCVRNDETETIDYELLIDLKKLEKTTVKEIAVKAAKYRKEFISKSK